MISSIKIYPDLFSADNSLIIENEDIELEFELILKSHNNEYLRFMAHILKFIEQELGYQPWAIVAYKHQYNIFEHINSVLINHPDIKAYNYSSLLGRNELRPTSSLFFIKEKSSLMKAILETPLFATAWWELREMSINEKWFCIPDSPSIEWTTKQENEEILKKKILLKSLGKINAKTDEKENSNKNEHIVNKNNERELRVRCYICGRETSYELFSDDGLARLCRYCHRQISPRADAWQNNDDVNKAFQNSIRYKIDHPEDD